MLLVKAAVIIRIALIIAVEMKNIIIIGLTWENFSWHRKYPLRKWSTSVYVNLCLGWICTRLNNIVIRFFGNEVTAIMYMQIYLHIWLFNFSFIPKRILTFTTMFVIWNCSVFLHKSEEWQITILNFKRTLIYYTCLHSD